MVVLYGELLLVFPYNVFWSEVLLVSALVIFSSELGVVIIIVSSSLMGKLEVVLRGASNNTTNTIVIDVWLIATVQNNHEQNI